MTGRRIAGPPPRPAAPRAGTFRQLRILFLLIVLLLVERDDVRNPLLEHALALAALRGDLPDRGRCKPRHARLCRRRSTPSASSPSIAFFAREAKRYGVELDDPVKTRLRPELRDSPPQRAPDASIPMTMLWSLKLRFWAWRVSGHVAEPEDIRMFVLYHDPALTPVVPHSLGLEKGLIGVVYAFATPDMDGTNDVVIAHELLHTLGATDKYDPGTDAPSFPDGYGDPRQVPLYPAGHRRADGRPAHAVRDPLGRARTLWTRWSWDRPPRSRSAG